MTLDSEKSEKNFFRVAPRPSERGASHLLAPLFRYAVAFRGCGLSFAPPQPQEKALIFPQKWRMC